MPLYDYRCQVCGEEFEELVPYMGKDTIRHCGELAERQISMPSHVYVFCGVEGYDRNMGEVPVRTPTKKEFLRQAKKRGLVPLD